MHQKINNKYLFLNLLVNKCIDGIFLYVFKATVIRIQAMAKHKLVTIASDLVLNLIQK